MGKSSSNGTTTAPAKAAPQQAPQRPAAAPPDSMRGMLEAAADRLAQAAPAHLTPERLVQVVSTLVYRTPKLQQCDRASIFASVLRAASLGLDLEPALNEAFLIPRWNDKTKSNECQFQIGYQGLRKLATQSGEVAYIQARVVHAADAFHLEYAPELVFRHQPARGADRGPVTDVYAVGKLRSGDLLVEVMTADEVEAIHRRSEGYRTAQRYGKPEQGPWATDWEQMACKTVLKRLCKSLPRSLELARAIDADDAEYRHDGPKAVVSAPPRAGSRAEALEGRLAGQLEAPDPEPEFTEGVERPVYSEDDEFPADELEPGPGADG